MPQRKDFIIVFLSFFIVVTLTILVTRTNIFEDALRESPFGKISQLTEIKIPILMYHYIEYNQDERDFLRDQQNVPPHVFEQQIIDLRNAGYTFITPKDIPNLLTKRHRDNKYVVLSFDDGFRDFYTDAFPILKKHKIPVINYIVYNFMGGQDYMTEEMVLTIAKNPLIEIGAHTLNHATLSGIEKEYAEGEISLSKGFLEEKFGIEVTSFAYPYGSHDEEAIKLVKKAGYTTAVTVEQGNMVTPNNLYTLKRIRPGHLTGEALINYINR
jgi:peptidoglycan/xylan/chitin deacetylase (PgdA/CDA1 family)